MQGSSKSFGNLLPKPRTTSSNVFGAGGGAPKPAIICAGLAL